jgi:hypothetical protein
MREVSHKPASNRMWSINDPGIAPLQSVAQGALGNAMQSVRRKYRSPGFQKFSQRAAQRISDLLERLDGGVGLTRLDQGNCRLRQPGPLRQIGLSQACAPTRPEEVDAENGNRWRGRRAVARWPRRWPGLPAHADCPSPSCPAASQAGH